MGDHLVTGGNGFVGKLIVQALLEAGKRVRVIDLLPQSEQNSRVKFFQGDIFDPVVLENSLENVEVVHHCAAHVPLTRIEGRFYTNNCIGTRLVLESALRMGVRHFNYISSSAVYGRGSESAAPISETAETAPFDYYSVSKKSAEDEVMRIMDRQNSMTCTILRPRTVVSPGRLGILEMLFEWIRKGRRVFLIGNGKNMFQMLDGRDLAWAAMAAEERRCSGVFNLGADRYGTLFDAIDDLRQHAGSASKIMLIPSAISRGVLVPLNLARISPLSAWHYSSIHKNWHFDITQAKTQLQWQPRYSNNEMLRDSYDWYIRNREAARGQEYSVHRRPLAWGVLRLLK